MSRNYYQIQDAYKHLKNPQRYKGTLPLTLRSGYEINFVTKWLDTHQDIIEWGSESVIIPYRCPVRNGSTHRYFIDFNVKMKNKKGEIVEFLIEIKPFTSVNLVENLETYKPKRMTKGGILRIQTAMKDKAKWNAAEMYCEQERKKGRNIFFQIIHENNSPVKLT
jgi:hypothetical protein